MDTSKGLDGLRVLVVGASSGIGRAIALRAVAGGARVVLSARREALLREAVAEALSEAVPRVPGEEDRAGGGRAFARGCDVRDPAAVDALAEAAVADLGGLDALVYATGVDPLVRMADAGAELWDTVLATNVVGASLVTRALLRHLEASGGRAVYLSASAVGRPLPGMGPYDASKAALEEMARAWRAEHPSVCFSCAAVGPVLGTGVGAAWDRELLGALSPRWERGGYLADNGPGWMTVEEAADGVLAALTVPVCMRDFDVLPDPAGRV